MSFLRGGCSFSCRGFGRDHAAAKAIAAPRPAPPNPLQGGFWQAGAATLPGIVPVSISARNPSSAPALATATTPPSSESTATSAEARSRQTALSQSGGHKVAAVASLTGSGRSATVGARVSAPPIPGAGVLFAVVLTVVPCQTSTQKRILLSC